MAILDGLSIDSATEGQATVCVLFGNNSHFEKHLTLYVDSYK